MEGSLTNCLQIALSVSTMNYNITTLLRLGEDSVCEFKAMRILGKRVTVPDAKEVSD